MSIEQLNYYRVSCDGLEEKSGDACTRYINVAARDLSHATEVIKMCQWVGRVINHGIIFDSWPGFYALCPAHKES